MKYIFPERLASLKEERKDKILKRSAVSISEIFEEVRKIVYDVKERGDEVFLEHYKKLKSSISNKDLIVTKEEITSAYKKISKKVVKALIESSKNIEKFHKSQLEKEMWMVEVDRGIIAGRMNVPINSAGVYLPGRKAFYPSSVLMTVIPAKVAGVKNIIACTPPNEDMKANEATLVAADICGVDRIFKIGGPWAIAGMAFGTKTIPKVDKIVGPGNKYVTAAKLLVFGEVNIDSPAGPSEVLIIADEDTPPQIAALDFLSQIEHDEDAASVLLTTSPLLAERICEEINRKVEVSKRKDIIISAIGKYSAVLICRDFQEIIDFANEYAAEHLEILTAQPFEILPKIKNAGSIFVGVNSPVCVGDYASGTNHTLPTGGGAKMFSGLSVDDFIKKPTFQFLSKEGLIKLKETILTLATAEGLYAHADSLKARF